VARLLPRRPSPVSPHMASSPGLHRTSLDRSQRQHRRLGGNHRARPSRSPRAVLSPTALPGGRANDKRRPSLLRSRYHMHQDFAQATDEELIALHRVEENPEALSVLYRRYYARVASWCLRFSGSPAQSEELAQEVFTRTPTDRRRVAVVPSGR
jgi:hypothetical protein